MLAREAENEQRDEDHVERDDGAHEVDLPKCFVQVPPKHLREPERDGSKGCDDPDREERVVEMSQDEVGIVKVDVSARSTEIDARHATQQKLEDEGQRPQHRSREPNRPPVEGGNRTEHDQRDGHRDQQGRHREYVGHPRVDSRDELVVGPDGEADDPRGESGIEHRRVAKELLTSEDRDDFGHNPHCGQ